MALRTGGSADLITCKMRMVTADFFCRSNAHETLAENSRVATKFALVSSASFQRENMADDEDAVAAACAIVAILADSHNRKRKIKKYGYNKTDRSPTNSRTS